MLLILVKTIWWSLYEIFGVPRICAGDFRTFAIDCGGMNSKRLMLDEGRMIMYLTFLRLSMLGVRKILYA